MNEVALEYNLVEIDFNWEWNYIPSDDIVSHFVADDSTIEAFAKTPEIEYDESNIPKGNSKEEIKMREKIIKDFYAQWIASNPAKKVWNECLHADIYVKFVSINETFAKAARTYKSTCAVFLLSDILKTAVLVKKLDPKANKNQRPYEKMLLMRAFDNVKLIVGLQRSSQEHVQYSITVPEQ